MERAPLDLDIAASYVGDIAKVFREASDALLKPHRVDYSRVRRFATAEEASSASRGFEDFPFMHRPDSAAYRTGWHDANEEQTRRDDERAERGAAMRDE